MTVSSPISTLFVGAYSSAAEPALHTVRFDNERGELTLLNSFTGIENPSFVIVHPNGRWLYTVSETGVASGGAVGSVWAFQIDGQTNELQPLNQQSTAGDWPCHLAIDPSGRWMAVSNYGSGSVAIFPILPDGRLGERRALMQHEGHGPNQQRQEGPHAHSTTFMPDNQTVIVADLGIDQLVVYDFDAEKGEVARKFAADALPGAGPRHLALHPNGRTVYVANELDSTVAVYGYDPDAGELTAGQSLPTVPAGVSENSVADIHLSPGGERLYVSNRGHNSIAVFAVADDGGLTTLAFPQCGGEWPRNFALGPAGKFVLVANRHTDAVVVLPVLNSGQFLGEPVGRLTIPQPSCIAFG